MSSTRKSVQWKPDAAEPKGAASSGAAPATAPASQGGRSRRRGQGRKGRQREQTDEAEAIIAAAVEDEETTLFIHGCGLQTVPESVKALGRRLTMVDAGRNRLLRDDSWPKWTAEVFSVSLVTLRLEKNALKRLPVRISEFSLLQNLDLGRNAFREFPIGLRSLSKQLVRLDLGLNKLKELPQWIEEFTKLEWLDLYGNFLASVPDSMENLTRLRELFLGNNRLRVLPRSFSALTGLNVLNLTCNPDLTVPPFIPNNAVFLRHQPFQLYPEDSRTVLASIASAPEHDSASLAPSSSSDSSDSSPSSDTDNARATAPTTRTPVLVSVASQTDPLVQLPSPHCLHCAQHSLATSSRLTTGDNTES